MKLRLPRALFRALVACFTALASTSQASASSAPGVSVSMRFAAPDVEQDGSLLCWAASAADILSLETGQDAAAIYRCITEASGNTAGYVESALSWYKEGAKGELAPQSFDGSHTVTRSRFESLAALAENVQNALKESRAAALTLYARGDAKSTGHAVTVYASAFERGRLYLSYADSADGVKGVRRAEVVESEFGFVLAGTNYAVGSITSIGEDGAADTASGAPVGAYLHSSPLYQEYSDLAENRGVYRFAYMPSVIMYQNGEDNYMVAITPDYSVVADQGCYTLVNYGSFQVTVEHNGVMGGGTFSSRFVGSENAQQYNCVGIRDNQTFVFGWSNPYVPTGDDFKIERVSRLVTDANSSAWCSDNNHLNNLNGVMYYRVGAGTSGYFDADGNVVSLATAWGYGLTAGIGTLDGGWFTEGTSVFHVGDSVTDFVYTSATKPLPSATQSGDSGSPVFIYNEETGQFELISCLQGGGTYSWGTRYNGDAVSGAIDFLEVSVSTNTNYDADNASATTYYISGARIGVDDELISNDGASAYLRKGTITLDGATVATYNGVSLDEFWEGTWKMLDADDLKWYTYTDYEYLNAAFSTATDANTFGQDDLFYTSNIKLVADASADGSAAYRRVELTEDVDLGVGYVQYSLGEGVTEATFDLAKDSSEYHLSSAGFIIDEGVTVNNYITYEKGRELRRVGAGIMNIVGEGNSDVLLNLGGGGTTLLNRTNGYGAYSALVNTEAVLSLADAGQVYNNVTLGAGGGVLDFNGNDYRWTSGGARAEGSDGETYFGLTVYDGINRVEESYVVNYASGTTSTITIERSDDFEFAGAFRDGSSYSASTGQAWDSRYTMMPSVLIDSYYQFKASERVDSDSALKVVYDGGATMTMTGVYTVLTGDSGFEVASGNVVLQGTNTIHAIGSESGTNTNRLQVENDWHYAMAEMPVTVQNGASFELGHHALLIGDVTVESGGTFTMKQAVNQRYEYVEGWYVTEDTYALSDYYGLKGNVSLESGAEMDIRFDEGVSTALTYAGNISGEGSLTVAVGSGSVKLTGSNTFSGEKTVESGNLRLAAGAEGNTSTNKWLIQEQGSLALESVTSNADVLAHVDSASTGVLALTSDLTEQVTLTGIIVGAAEGETVHYGSAEVALTAVDGSWTLGGGGGTLYVDFLLTGANTLVLGNEYGTGTVVLTNSQNTFSGGIDIVGDITLEYTDIAALGAGSSLSLSYSNVLKALSNDIITTGKLAADADGVYAVTDGTQDYDLTRYTSLALGANGTVTLTGALTVAEGAAYRFGGSGALTIDTALSGEHDIVIDGQGNPGSSVTIAQAATTTGDVLIQGFDTAQGVTTGDVTVSFTVNNALSSASSVTLRNDSGVNLNGTDQSFNNLTIEQGSLIFDDIGGNTLTLNYSDGSYAYESDMQLALTNIVKSGVGAVTLSGSNAWAGMDIQAGTVTVTSDASLGGNTSVADGATLHITNWSETAHEVVLNIAGEGASGQAGALVYDYYHANTKATINLTDDATISAANGLRVNTINLGGHELTINSDNSDGGHFSVSSTIAGEGGSIIADNIHLRSLYGSNYNLTVQGGGSLNIDGYSGGATIGLTLNNANFNMGNGGIADDSSAGASTFNGSISIGSSGATISNSSGHDKDFNLAGMITGTGTLNLISGNGKTINLQGGMDLDATLALGWGVNVNVTKHAAVNALTGYGSLTVTDSTLELDGTGTNYEGSLTLSGDGHLKLSGQSGSSLGSFSTLAMGDSGVLTFANLSGYTSSAMLNVGTVTGSKMVAVDVASLSGLSSGTYQLLSGTSEFSDWTLANTTNNSRIGLALVAGGSEGAYTLSLTVTQGTLQTVTWTGTGTLTAGTSDSTHISSTAGDYQFLSFDHLVITSNSGESNTLTLGETIYASSVTYSGAGAVTLAQSNGATFADGVGLTLSGSGELNLASTTAVTGEVKLESGTLTASSASLNALSGISVAEGKSGTLVLTSDDVVTTSIDIGGTLTLSSQSSENGRQLESALSGSGDLIKIGNGKLILQGNNSGFTGTVAVNAGTLKLGSWGTTDFSLNASSFTMAAGTTLELESSAIEYAADFTWGAGTTLIVRTGSGDGPDPTSVAYLLSGTQTLNGALTYQSQWGKVTHISGDIVEAEGTSGALSFSKTNNGGGSPAVVLSGNNTYTGGTTLNFSNLTLYAGSQQAFGTGILNLNAGTLSWTGVGGDWDGDLSVSSIVLGGGAMSTYGQDVSLSTVISGEGALTKQGAGTLTLSGELSYTGATTLEEGSLVLNAQLVSTEDVTVNKATILRVGGEYLNGNTVNLVSSLGGKVAQVIGTADALSSAGEYVISSGGNAMGVGYIGITEGGYFDTGISGEEGALLIASPETTYMRGTISGDLSVSMAGDFVLMTANTYTGGTELTEGTLQIAHASALGSGSLVAHDGSTVEVQVEATIAGDSYISDLAFGDAGKVVVGTSSEAGSLEFGNISSGNASFALDIFSEDSYDYLVGDLTGGTIDVTLAANDFGTYTLVQGAVGAVDAFTLNLSGTDATNYSYTWASTGDGLTLTIDYNTDTVNLWTGSSGDEWNGESTTAWNYGSFNDALARSVMRVKQDTNITVSAAVGTLQSTNNEDTIFQVDTAKGATLTLSNNTEGAGSITATTLQKEGDGTLTFDAGLTNSFTKVVINEGTISIASANALGTTAISGEGTLELTGGSMTARLHDTLTVSNIRITNGASLTFTSDTSAWGGTASGKTIEIVGEGSSLSMTQWSNLNASSLILRDGGTIYSGDNGFGNNGGTIYVDGSGSLKYGSTGGGNVAATISGHGTLSVADWNAGHWVSLNGLISDDASAETPLALNLSQNYVVLSTENTYSGGTTITAGTVIAATESSLGTGSLHMTGGKLTMSTTFRDTNYSTDLAIGSLSGTGGTIERGSNALTITQTEAGSFAGTLNGSGSLTKLGDASLSLTGTGDVTVSDLTLEAGSLSIAGAVTVTGAYTQAEGTTASFGALTLSNATSLNMGSDFTVEGTLTLSGASTFNYSSLESYAGVGSVALAEGASLTLSLSNDIFTYLAGTDSSGALNTYDLGADLSSTSLTLSGYDADTYTIITTDGRSYLQLTSSNEWVQNYASVVWDANWGTLDDAPASVRKLSLTETTALYENSLVDNGERVVATVSNTGSSAINVFALINADDASTAGSTLTHDAWLEVTGGTFGIIAAANLNNWNSSAAWNLEGDMHIMVNGSTNVDNVIGFTDKDAKAPSLTGDTYVSVGSGVTVNDSIVGGGVLQHGHGITMTGDTHVVVNGVQADGTVSNGGSIGNTLNSVVGGHAHGQGSLSSAIHASLDGSTNVLINLADSATGEFSKTIVGGHRSDAATGSITGDSKVTINAGRGVSFTDDIVAGSVTTSNSETIGGDSTLTINGGTYSGGTGKFLIGGNWVTAGESSISGTASVILGGDAVINRHVFVAGYAGGGTSTVAATRLEIGSGVTIGDGIKLSGGFTSSANGTVTGNQTLALGNGVDLTSTTSTLERFNRIEVAEGSAKLDASKFVNLSTYTKTGDGTLELTGTVAYSASEVTKLTIAGGAVKLDSAKNLTMDGDTSSTAITISAGTLSLDADFSIGTLTGGDSGVLDLGSNHSLTINQTTSGTFRGTLVGVTSLTKNGDAGFKMTNTAQEYNLTALTVNGGDLILAGAVNLSGALTQADDTFVRLGSLTMTSVQTLAMGELTIDGALTMVSGSTLSYTSVGAGTGAGGAFTLTGGNALTLNVTAEVLSDLSKGSGFYDVLDLGVTLTDTMISNASVTGLESYSDLSYEFGTDSSTGHTTLILTDASYSDVSWDANWGADGLADAPTRLKATTVSEATAFYNSSYDDGETIAVSITNNTSSSAVNLYATSSDGTSLTRDTWLEITGGTYGTIAGSSGASITGDMHVMVSGGTVEGDIVGFNATTANGGPTHTGSSYITVGEGVSVTGSIVGAGISTTGSGGTLNGSTNIFVYEVQSAGTASTGTASNESTWSYNAIIGGFARTLGYGVEWTINGDTNVTLDLTDDSGTFSKNIYGGNVSERFSHIGTITGDTNVSIAARNDVIFSSNIVAGSYKGGTESWRTDVIQGSSILTIDGGTYNAGGYLTAGSLVSGGTSTIGGTASVILNGGVINRDIYAAGISTGGTSTVGNSLVTINSGVTLGSGVTVSGGFEGSGGTASVTGTRTLAFGDGVDLSSSTVSFADFDTVKVESGNASVAASTLSNLASVNKTGSGTLTLNGSTTQTVTLSEGTLAAAESGLTIGGLSAESSSGAALALMGNLTVNQSDTATYAGGLSGEGSFIMSGSGALTLSASKLSAGAFKTTAGELHLTGSHLSAGTLVVEGGTMSVNSITLTDSLSMSQSSLTVTTLTMAAGTTLEYSNATDYASITNFSAKGALTLSLSDDLINTLKNSDGSYNSFNLGLTLADTTNVSVAGFDSNTYAFETDGTTGHTLLTLLSDDMAAYYAVTWDKNWGVTGPEKAWHTTVDSTTGFYGTEKYDDGTTISASVIGNSSSSAVNVFATVNLTSYDSNVTITEDAWLEVMGGTYGVIGGASINNWGNWNSSSIEGDIHIMVSGGSADYVVGLSHKDAHTVSMTGDTYISVYDGATINDSIIGGGISQQRNGISLDGNTNVFVYGVLANGTTHNDPNYGTNNANVLGLSNGNAVIGANAWGYDSSDTANLLSLTGNSAVTIDVSSGSGSFEKAIYGGNASYALNATIGGSSSVNITANDNVSFTGNVAAGSYSTGNADDIAVGTSLTINSGVFSGDAWLTGGSIVSSGTSTIGGTASVTLSGGTISRNVYAAGISTGGTSTVGNSLVTINSGVTLGDAITVSGGFGGTGGTGSVTGTRTLAFGDGVNLASSTVNFTDFDAVQVASGNAAVAASTLDNLSSIVKTGAGTLTLNGSTDNAVTLSAGTLALGSDLTLGGLSGEADTAVTMGSYALTLNTSADAADYAGSVTGSANITMAGSGSQTLSGSVQTTGNIKATAGSLTLSGDGVSAASLTAAGGALTVSGNNLAAGSLTVTSGSMSLTGTGATAETLTVSGGSMEIADITLTGDLDMNQSGLTITSLTMADGTALTYTGQENLASLGSVSAAGSLTLSLSADLMEYLTDRTADGSFNTFDLGTGLSSVASAATLAIGGLDSSSYTYTISTDADGHSILQLTGSDYDVVSWDANWGETELASAPAGKTLSTTLLINTQLSGSSYDDGSRIFASVKGTDSTLDLYATVNLSGIWDSAVSLERDTWVEVTGGTFGIIAGAFLNNWGDSASTIVGDLHYQMSGGSANAIIGFSYKDAKHPTLTGSTYISVYEGATINDSIIGGSELHHNAGVTLTGNTNIFIYDVLDTNAETLSGTSSAGHYAVIGGHAYGTNTWGNTAAIGGSTSILVDVSDYEGDATNFEKSIYGGNLSGTTNGSGLAGSIGQGTLVSIDANELVTFTADIAAGSKVTYSEAISGGTSLTIDGGVFASGAVLTGGSYVTGGTSTIEGGATVTLNGGTINRDVYAAGYSTGGTSTVDSSLVKITDSAVSFGEGVTVSGGFGGTGGTTSVTGARTLSLANGVNLSAVTVKDFDHVSVASGSATVNSANLGDLTKQGSGALALSAGLAEGANLSVEEGSLTAGAALTLGNLSGAAGTSVNMGGYDLSITQSTEGSFAGALTKVGSLTVAGDAALTLSSVAMDGTLSMSASNLTIDTLTLANGAALSYSSSTDYTSVSSFTAEGALTLNISESLLSDLKLSGGAYTTLSLGLDLGTNVADYVSVSGLDGLSYEFGTSATGLTTLQITDANYVTVSWDAAWKKGDSAPTTAYSPTVDASTSFYNDSTYDDGKNIVASVKGSSGESPVNLSATVNGSAYSTGSTENEVSRDAWLEVTGGSFGIIGGLNSAGGSTGSENWKVTGDIHIQMSGGTVNDIVGYSYNNVSGNTLSGNTYISVYEGATVYGSVIGGGVAPTSNTVYVNGSTNVFIYDVLDQKVDSFTGDSLVKSFNAVIGGSANSGDHNVYWQITGSSNVTIDLSAYEGESANFVKSVYGGSMSNGQWGYVGSTNVSITAGDNVTFTDNIVAGSYHEGSSGYVQVSGDSTLTINGGIYDGGSSSFLIGGNWVTNGESSSIKGTATIVLDGDAFINRHVYAAGYSSGGTSEVGATRVEIGKDVTFADSSSIHISGGFTSSANGTVTGDRTLALADGVDLSGASVTIKNFSVIEVDSGSAKLNANALADMSTFTKSGNGALELGGSGVMTNMGTPLVITVNDADEQSADFVEMTISAQIGASDSDGIKLRKDGDGTLLLSGSNLHAWGTHVDKGTLIAANDSALGTGSVEVASGATLEVASGTYVNFNNYLKMAEGSELVVHSLKTDDAALAANGNNGSATNFTLTLASDMQLTSGSKYVVLSGVTTLDANGVGVNNLTDTRYAYTMSAESTTLYLTATKEDNISLVWNGTEDASVWNQNSANTNWKTADEAAEADYFANLDTVEFSDAASGKSVTVADTGVKVTSMTVSGSDYSFSGGSINLGEAYSVSRLTGAEATSGAVISNVKMTQSSISGIVGEGSLDYVMIDIAEGTSLKLENLVLGTNAHITDDPATVDLSNVTVKLGSGNATMQGAGQTISSGSSLVATGGSFTLDLVSDMSVYNVISNAFDTVGVTGTSLTLDLSGYSEWLGSLDGYNYIAISFGESADSLATFSTENLTINATLDGSTYNPVFVTDLASATTLYIPVSPDAAPEPTTTTLSLLALSLLAARRRRAWGIKS